MISLPVNTAPQGLTRWKKPNAGTFQRESKDHPWSARLAPSVEYVALDLRVGSSSPRLGVEVTKNKLK